MQDDGSPTILVIDDAPEMLDLLKDMLTARGFRVRIASGGRMALDVLSSESPDAILLDVDMPGMDGYEVCRRMKADERTSGIPVIFLSGFDEIADKVKGFAAGGVDYITKPFQSAEVLARLETHLALHRLQKQLEERNIQLHREVAERRQAEEALQRHKAHLEDLIAERTADLKHANEELHREITERGELEAALEHTNYRLHSLVYEYGVRKQRIALFNHMSARLQACLSLEETYPIISQYVQKLFPGTAGTLMMFKPRGGVLESVTHWGAALCGEATFPAKGCMALREKRMRIALEPPGGSCERCIPCQPGSSSICIPLSTHEETLGILHLQKRAARGAIGMRPDGDEQTDGISADAQQLSLAMADFIALALVNIKLRENLKQQAIRDPLTGLFNRRYLEATLDREIRRAGREEAPLGIIMIDLDHFGRFNNTFGHEAGDIVLQDVGRFLQSNIRKEDVACRYGGEEFTLILPGASLANTQKRAEALRRKAECLQICYQEQILENVTLSLGVAAFPEHGATGNAILKAADSALYRAKHAGRNRVTMARNIGKTRRGAVPADIVRLPHRHATCRVS